ncbi:precorrin-6y C5,15-methyltransferase (decarboxylating) subunit CbiE [Desertibacillus haloalkaliphilus]|uniref:precorrin-6y C5,15-methyltransferase (decarboxylating) subunit CbiE n=1 Tax=Desertibacillus haloalkaliphilus TaxID=1328930 RepID=UPI001C27FED1|nr:precorrin-6y C5,15-methyltransferase (decarboxylating) subunit CbiE [Desertibacillus haloalkaliphilus]MBU8907812.1 precorrin-6y C5,15-methyltransferase (decarboxylating) subunit CbiE [Desertibacillus haloalkaliphilus]
MREPIKVIGIGDRGQSSLLPIYHEWIYESERLVGGERHLNFFPDYKGEKVVLQGGLKKVIDELASEEKQTVVLASGDPLFYGIGSYLAKKLESVEIYPHISSIQEAFAKLQESWQDCTFISVHGRKMKGLAQKVDGCQKVCLLTDEENTPAAIANYLLSFGFGEYEAFVAEALGGENEKTTKMTLEEMADYKAHPLNVVILKQVGESPKWPLGIADGEFSQRKPDKGLITKKEVRVLSLSELQLKQDSIVWDIGTCTGSIAIEAAKIARFGEVYAIEKNEPDLKNFKENTKKFRTDVTVVQGKAPQGLDQFPNPDAIFLGGTGGEMRELLHVCCNRLKQGGRIVLNAATVESLYEATQAFADEGFEVNITLAQISRSKPILHMNRFEGLNPIYIICAKQKEDTTA